MTKTLLIAFLLGSMVARAQIATFDVVMAGHTIGSVKVLEPNGTERLRKRIEAEFRVPFYAHTITGLYYQEPAQVPAVYSEKYGAMCKITKLGNGHYSVELPNGKESVYSYERGNCVRVVTELAGVKLSIVRKQRPL